MSRAEELELDAAQYVLGLEGLGLGAKGNAIRQRCLIRDIEPLLKKQRKLMQRAKATGTVLSVLSGEDREFWGPDSWLEPVVSSGAPWSDECAKLDGQIEAAWERCLEQLRVLWITERPQSEESEVFE